MFIKKPATNEFVAGSAILRFDSSLVYIVQADGKIKN
jgi:hypothetical protein